MTPIIKRSAVTTAVAITALALAGMSTDASASTTSTNLGVSTTIPSSCTTSNVQNIAFTNPTSLTVTQTDNAGSVDVTCTNGGVYTVAAGNGLNFASSTRNMKSTRTGSSAVLSYGLFTDSGRTSAFTTSTQLVGNGTAQTFNIYGRLNTQIATEAGSYSDTVALTVTY